MTLFTHPTLLCCKRCLRSAFLALVLCLSTALAAQESRTQSARPLESSAAHQQQEPDTLLASFITCGPGDESYELYGHTAIRLRSKHGGEDVVYNYGYFNFRQPHFVWHFVLGETDYSLRTMSWERFYTIYTEEGRWIDEQLLDLSPEETARLAEALTQNEWEAMVGGWTYRYNYLTDNCTTRAIDQILSAIDGTLVLPETAPTTYRTALHRYTAGHAWAQFGNDMLLGAGCDVDIDTEGQLFLPLDAEALLQASQVKRNDGTQRPLIKSQTRVANLPDKPADTRIPPIVWVSALLVLTISLTLWEHKQRRTAWGYDVLLLTTQGLAGCIIAFMLTVSQHPTVDSNLLISWLNPLPLIVLWPVVSAFRRKRISRYFILQIAMTSIFFFIAIAQLQQFPVETYVLALCLLIRAVWHTMRRETSRTSA